MKSSSKSKAVKVGVSLGVAGLAAAAAGAYLFGGKHGAKNRQRIVKWTDAAKKDLLKQIAGMKSLTQKTYAETVDAVMAQYKKLKHIDAKELVALSSELKDSWQAISNELANAGRKIVPVVKKAAKAVRPHRSVVESKSVAKKSLSRKGRKT